MVYYQGNGGPYVTDASEFYHDGQQNLTDAPMIVTGKEYPDSGHVGTWGSVWWFPNYAVESEVETLFRTGRVVFSFGYEIGKPRDCEDCRRYGEPDGQPTGNRNKGGFCAHGEGDLCPTCGGRGFVLESYRDLEEWFKIERTQFRCSEE